MLPDLKRSSMLTISTVATVIVLAAGLAIHTVLPLSAASEAFAIAIAEHPPITIFVGPQTRDGFVDVDQGVLDSIKDITKALRGGKGFRVVPTRDDAQIVLEVLSRGITSASGGGAVAAPVGSSTFLIPMSTRGIATMLRVETYEKPIVFPNCPDWGYCARLVVKDIETWVAANPSVADRKPQP
jgi:hypothetical protein